MAEAPTDGPNKQAAETGSSQSRNTVSQGGDVQKPPGLRNTLAPLIAGPIAGVCSRFVICEWPLTFRRGAAGAAASCRPALLFFSVQPVEPV